MLLSGGLDSSLIASIAARETDKMAKQQEEAVKERKAAAAEGREAREFHSPVDILRTRHEDGDTGQRRDRRDSTDPTDDEEPLATWPRLHSFAIGLPGAPDLVAARKAADFLGTIHHEYHFTVQEGLDAIPEVIHHLETFDVTTVRASTPMYLLSRKIKAMGVKMVLSGEGSDEIFGGTFIPTLMTV